MKKAESKGRFLKRRAPSSHLPTSQEVWKELWAPQGGPGQSLKVLLHCSCFRWSSMVLKLFYAGLRSIRDSLICQLRVNRNQLEGILFGRGVTQPPKSAIVNVSIRYSPPCIKSGLKRWGIKPTWNRTILSDGLTDRQTDGQTHIVSRTKTELVRQYNFGPARCSRIRTVQYSCKAKAIDIFRTGLAEGRTEDRTECQNPWRTRQK